MKVPVIVPIMVWRTDARRPLNGFERRREFFLHLTMSEDSTHDLLTRATAGCCAAFGELMDHRIVRLTLFIRRNASGVLRGDCSEDDLLQTVLIAAWESLPQFEYRGPGSFDGWLAKLARYTISTRAKYLDGKGRNLVAASTSNSETGRLDVKEWAETLTSIVSRASRQEQIEALDKALQELDSERRRIVELSFLEGRSLTEIATDLGLPRSTVWDQLRGSMRQLRGVLDPVQPR